MNVLDLTCCCGASMHVLGRDPSDLTYSRREFLEQHRECQPPPPPQPARVRIPLSRRRA